MSTRRRRSTHRLLDRVFNREVRQWLGDYSVYMFWLAAFIILVVILLFGQPQTANIFHNISNDM